MDTSKSGTVDVNLTPDKRKIMMANESVLLEALKDKLYGLFESTSFPSASAQPQLTAFEREEPSDQPSARGDVQPQPRGQHLKSPVKETLYGVTFEFGRLFFHFNEVVPSTNHLCGGPSLARDCEESHGKE